MVLADYGDAPQFPSDTYHFISIGERNDTIIAHNLLTICLDHQVDALMPLYDFEIEEVLKSSVLFQEFNINVLVPEKGQVIPG